MKLIKRLFIFSFALLLLAGIGLYIFVSTFDANKYKPLIVEKAGEATGRVVDFKDISLHVSLSQGIRAALHDLSISENPAYGEGNFASVGEVFIGVDILAYLTKKEIALTAITVQSPNITVIKGPRGVMNVSTLGKAKTAEAAAEQAAKPTSPAAALPAVMVDALSIKNGTLTYIDRSLSPQTKASVTQLDFNVNNFSLNDSFDVSLKLAAFAASQNVNIAGKVKLDLANQGATVSDLSAVADLTATDISQLKTLPILEGKPLPDMLKGKLTAKLQQLTVNKGGVSDIIVDIKLDDGAFKMTQAPGTTLDIPAITADIQGFSLAGKPFSFKVNAAYGGTDENIALDGKASFNQQTKAISLADSSIQVDFTKLSLGNLKSSIAALKDKPLPDKLAGKLNANIKQLTIADGKLGTYAGDIAFTDGAIAFKQLSPGVALDIPSINFSLTGVAPGKAGTYDLKLAYLNDSPNIFSNGTVMVDTTSGGINISKGTLTTNLESVSLAKLKSSIASLKDAKLPESLKGKLAITNLQAKTGGGAPATYSGTLAVANGSAKLAQPAAPLENINSTIGFNQSDLDITSLALTIGKGSIGAKGKVADYTGAKRFALTLSAKDVAIDSLIDQSQSNEKLEGIITANAAVSGIAAQLDTSLSGKGDMNLVNGRLVNVNVLARVLDKITTIPNLQQALRNNLPHTWQQKLQKPDTEISKLHTAATITNGVVSIKPIDVAAEGFVFDGTGNYNLASKRYVLDGNFIIPQETATEMAAGVKELQYLMTAQKDIRFPLKVEGAVGGKSSFSPDVQYVVRNALENKGKDQILRVLEKKLNKDGKNDGKVDAIKGLLGIPPSQQQAPASQQQGGQPQSQQQQPAQQQLTPEQQLIQGVLKGFAR